MRACWLSMWDFCRTVCRLFFLQSSEADLFDRIARDVDEVTLVAAERAKVEWICVFLDWKDRVGELLWWSVFALTTKVDEWHPEQTLRKAFQQSDNAAKHRMLKMMSDLEVRWGAHACVFATISIVAAKYHASCRVDLAGILEEGTAVL